MFFVKTKSNGDVEQFPYTIRNLRIDNLPTTYPPEISDQMLGEIGVYRVTPNSKPTHDPLVQMINKNASPTKVGDQWVIGYTVENKPQDQAEAEIRNQRDRLLSETDWMALSDSPTITTEWANYRQALRDITGQAGFSYDVAWPTKPDGL
jgi:hypothetical protein